MASWSDPRVVCRPSLPADTDDVLAFTRRIWEGRDYIHLVWDEWLADPRGLLVSAQYGARIVGIAKITPIFPGQWWLHGLRVDPEYQGLKIGTHLHEYMNTWWLKHGDGTIRLLTSTKRVQVHHLCERTGYARLGEVNTYRRALSQAPKSEPRRPASGSRDTPFAPVPRDQLTAALDFARQHLPYTSGLMDTGWRFVLPDEASLADRVAAGGLHWWHGRDGLLATWEGDDDDGPVLGIGFAAVREHDFLVDLLRDAPGLADGLNVGSMFWLAPREPLVESALKEAGYLTDDDTGVLFARQHPGL